MWGLSVGLIVLIFGLAMIYDWIEATKGLDAASRYTGILLRGSALIVGIVLGINGNKWRETKLRSRGFDHQDTVSAPNDEEAIALWIKENESH